MKFYLGTTNQYKIRELAAILRPLGIELAVTDPVDPEETEDTFEGNARLKARVYAQHVGNEAVKATMTEIGFGGADTRTYLRVSQHWTISEDSGIAIPALGGLPGPFSARFDDCTIGDGQIIGHTESGRGRDEIDLANNLRVLQLMEGIEQPHRAAEFVISLVVANIDGQALFQTTQRVAGWVAPEMRGTEGFGYDSIFITGDTFGKTWAEIDSMRKNLISHRRKALAELTTWIASQIKRGVA